MPTGGASLRRSLPIATASWRRPGLGWADRRDAYRMSLFVAELIAVIEQERAGSGAVVVGHSFGGYVALCAAELRPDFVGPVVVVESPLDRDKGWAGPPAWSPMRSMRTSRSRSRERTASIFAATPRFRYGCAVGNSVWPARD